MWSAAILAGGRARRLGGQDKSALIVDGVRLLDRQLASLRPLTDSILLVGYPGPAPASCVVVSDHKPGTGPLGAIVTALSAAAIALAGTFAAYAPRKSCEDPIRASENESFNCIAIRGCRCSVGWSMVAMPRLATN